MWSAWRSARPVPVRPLAQIALVDDAETAVGADIAPGGRMQKEHLGRAVAVDAAAPMLLARQAQSLAEIDLRQLQGAPAATVGAAGIGGDERAPSPVGRRLAHPDAGQTALAGASLAIHGEHRARLAPTPPLLVAQHFRREARLRAAAGPPRTGRAKEHVGGRWAQPLPAHGLERQPRRRHPQQEGPRRRRRKGRPRPQRR